MSNIDFDFILEKEGFKTQGYVPDPENSKSGVTIASGFDLGARVLEDLKGLPDNIVELLTPFLSLKGANAQDVASNLEVSKDQGKIINEFAKNEAITKLKTKWQNSTGTSFDNLSTEQATVLASVAFQYGDLQSKTPNFWNQATSGDWVGAYKNLLNFGDNYNKRRVSEANYLFPALKKSIEDGTSTGIASDEAQTAINNVIESNPEYKEIADTVLNQQGTPIGEVVGNVVDTAGEFINNAQESIQKSDENARMIPKIVEGSNQINDEADKAQENYDMQSADEFINNIEEPQLWDLDFKQPYDQEDLDQINDVTFKRQQDSKKKYTLGDATAGSYESETIEWNLYKQFNAEKLAPDSSFQLTQEKLDAFALDLPDDFRDEFAHAHSDAHAQQIRQQLLSHLELEDKIYSQGRAKGTMLRLLAAFTDPAAWAAIIATDGILAPVIAIQKSVRAYRMLRKGFAGAVSIGGIESYLATQRPDYDIDDVMHGVLAGAFLGSLFGIRTPKIKSNSFTKKFKDASDESDTKLIRDDGGFTPTGGGGKNTPPKIFNKGDTIRIDNKGGTGTILGFNKTSSKLGNMNDNYVIKIDNKSKVSSTQNDKMVLSREIVDELNIKNNQSRSADLVPGPNNPNPLKPNGERTFDWYDPNYDLALHTTKRPDGRFEIKMIENQTGKPDELIMQVNRDGTVEIRKCL